MGNSFVLYLLSINSIQMINAERKVNAENDSFAKRTSITPYRSFVVILTEWGLENYETQKDCH